jgi:UDP-N-acetylglucosamine 2-epimerase (hydrolysing)
MKKILFMSGTRADYGKIKSLMRLLTDHEEFYVNIFVTGMHMLSLYGSTYLELKKDGFDNIHTFFNQKTTCSMDTILANTITGLSSYVHEAKPDAIVVHGDRVEALAGAMVGALNNIKVIHIEGGEVSGTIDESIRHAITKFAHIHCVANEEAAKRIRQLGESNDSIFTIGSPDIDVMLSDDIPSKEAAMLRYNIPMDWENWNIVLYHPVTTEVASLRSHVSELVGAIASDTGNKYLVIYPNNDDGSDIILQAYAERLEGRPNVILYPSIKFEYFLSLLKHSDVLIGNSSAGVREASIYGVPAVNIGSRQRGRYKLINPNGIMSVPEDTALIMKGIELAKVTKVINSTDFGDGDSDKKFLEVLQNPAIWSGDIQKRFKDGCETCNCAK